MATIAETVPGEPKQAVVDRTGSVSDSKVDIWHVEETFAREEGEKLGLWQAFRRWPKLSAYCLALTSTILLWGYDMAMSGNLAGLDQFKEDYGTFYEEEWIIASHWISLWDAAGPIGILIGSLFAGWFQDKVGRKKSLGLGSVTSVLSVLVSWCSHYAELGNSRNGVFMFGRLCQGITSGMVVTTTQTYMSEVLPSTLRGPIIAFFPIFFLVGQLVSAGVVLGVEPIEGPNAYRYAIASQWPFSLLPILISVVIPESPVYLVRRGRLEQAKRSQQRLSTSQDNVEVSLERIQVVILHEARQADADSSTNYLECFRGSDLRRTMLAMFGACIPQLFGISLLGQGAYFLQIGGMDSRPSMIFLLTGLAAAIVGNIVSMWSLTRWGRRTLIIATLIPITLLYIPMGICGSIVTSTTVWILGVTTNVIALCAGLGAWPASFCLTSEVSSLRLRAKTQGISWAVGGVVNFVISFVIPFIFNRDQGNLGAQTGYIWVGVTFLTLVATWFLVPETFRRTPIQLDMMFEQRLPARNFKHWQNTEATQLDSRNPQA